MRKIILGSVLVCSLLSSCNLDIEPENSMTYRNSFNTEKELNATTTSIQYYINSTIGSNFVLSMAGVLADNVQSNTQLREWNPRTVLSNDYSWKGLYDLIFESNLLLDNIYRTKDLSEERANYHKGQAEFALGLAYFLLAQRYGDAIITENSSVIKAYGLSSQAEVLNTAIDHAKKALDLLPTWDKLTDINGVAITERQTASKGTAATLLAQIYAWRGSITGLYHLNNDAQADYQNAIKYASDVIAGKDGVYRLCSTPEELCEYLSNEKSPNPEAIFSLYFDKTRSENVASPNEIARNHVSFISLQLRLSSLMQQTSVCTHSSMNGIQAMRLMDKNMPLCTSSVKPLWILTSSRQVVTATVPLMQTTSIGVWQTYISCVQNAIRSWVMRHMLLPT